MATGVFEYSLNFGKNFGLLRDTIILLDKGELTNSLATVVEMFESGEIEERIQTNILGAVSQILDDKPEILMWFEQQVREHSHLILLLRTGRLFLMIIMIVLRDQY